jgi:hypothetical protein
MELVFDGVVGKTFCARVIGVGVFRTGLTNTGLVRAKFTVRTPHAVRLVGVREVSRWTSRAERLVAFAY